MTNIQQAKLKYSYTVQANIFGSKKYKNCKPPGQHGANLRKKKLTEYGVQLRETKKLRLFYAIKQHYLKSRFNDVIKMRGNKVHNLVGLLESRLTTCVYRAKFASSINGARQLVSHGHVLVNGKKVDIGSYLVKVGDIISLKEESIRENHHILNAISAPERGVLSHLEADKFQVKFLRIPTVTEGLYFCPMNISAIIEFLSK